jgi:putative colanic acid biosynthesis acetyltransferase WcaF
MNQEPPYLGQHCVSPYPRMELAKRWLWVAVQSTLFRWSPRPCHAFRARLLKLFGATIPQPGQVVIFPSVRIEFPWRLTLEPRSMLGRNVIVYNLGRITLSRGANVSQYTHLCAGSHDYRRWSMPLIFAPITIGENAWIAADVFVGPGVTIGEYCVVGARSVVIKNLPPRKLCVGHPCRVVAEREPPQL